MNTSELRNSLRRARKLPSWKQRKHEKTLAFNACRLLTMRPQHRIACYLSIKNEAPTQRLLHALHKRGKAVYIPYIQGDKMRFCRWTPHSPMKVGAFGIKELRRSQHRCQAKYLDIIFAPLLGFDQHGNRVGMGGGYYDRSFAFKQHERKPPLVGFAYETQDSNKIRPQPWDVSLDYCVTNRKNRVFRRFSCEKA